MCIFPPLSNTVYEWVEWMWRMSERSGVDVENERAECLKRIRVLLAFAKKFLKYTLTSFCFVLMIM